MDIKLLKNVQATPARRETDKRVKKVLGYVFFTVSLLVVSALLTSGRVDARQTGTVDPQESLMSVAVNWYCDSIGFGCSSES